MAWRLGKGSARSSSPPQSRVRPAEMLSSLPVGAGDAGGRDGAERPRGAGLVPEPESKGGCRGPLPPPPVAMLPPPAFSPSSRPDEEAGQEAAAAAAGPAKHTAPELRYPALHIPAPQNALSRLPKPHPPKKPHWQLIFIFQPSPTVVAAGGWRGS